MIEIATPITTTIQRSNSGRILPATIPPNTPPAIAPPVPRVESGSAITTDIPAKFFHSNELLILRLINVLPDELHHIGRTIHTG